MNSEIPSKTLGSNRRMGIQARTGDTKVVEKGKGDGIFINTAGVGVIEEGVDISPLNIRAGDKVIVSGSIGNHGVSVMAERNGISFEPKLLSDVRPLHGLVGAMLRKTKKIHVMRDPTRGGLATTLKELASASGLGILINEDSVEIKPGVKGASELLGLDPFDIANEGILVAFVDGNDAGMLVEQ